MNTPESDQPESTKTSQRLMSFEDYKGNPLLEQPSETLTNSQELEYGCITRGKVALQREALFEALSRQRSPVKMMKQAGNHHGGGEKKGLTTSTPITFCDYDSGIDSSHHKITLNPNESTTPSQRLEDISAYKTVTINRLPGESLGVEVDIKRLVGSSGNIQGVFVSRLIKGAATDLAASNSKNKVEVGDEILSINDKSMREVSHSEVVEILNEMPLRVKLTLRPARMRNESGMNKIPSTSLQDLHNSSEDQQYPKLNQNEKLRSSMDSLHSAFHTSSPYLGSEGSFGSPYALQSCKPSFIHEGYDLRKFIIKKRREEELGLQVESCDLDSFNYLKVVSG